VTNSPEDEARRDRTAIGHVAALLPGNAEEALVAAQYVGAHVYALDCLRLAREHPSDAPLFLKCTAQSATMMRQALRWRALLQRLQSARQLRGADTVARDAAAQSEHRALQPMAEALATAPAPAQSEAPQSDPIIEAEHYALHHRKRAALIRRFGRLPQKLDFGPMSPELVHAIATGATPILRALEK
jgi:hypothetical protein